MNSNPTSKPPVVVLSYNICFQAMTNNSSGSAPVLGRQCTYLPGSKLTTCGNTMANMIEAIPKSVNVSSLDFVGLQEASHWYELTAAAPNTLGKMTCFHSRQGRSDMASYYDGNNYTLSKHFTGEFSTDRPFQVLVFKNKFNNSGTIFINVHNPHSYSFHQIQSHLSAAVKGQLTAAEKSYRIIAVGDYNETSWDWQNNKMKCNAWTPFFNEDIYTAISVGKPVISCAEDGKWSDVNFQDKSITKRGGDYVFDSKSYATIQVPPAYDNTEYMSDHLPVLAVLQ